MFQFLQGLVRTSLVTKDMGAVMSSVVMAVACAEAYVNELGYMSLNKEPDAHRRFINLRTNVVRKFEFLADGKQQPYDEGEEPLRSFGLLIGLRGFIVHYEITEEPLEAEMTRLEKQLAECFPLKRGDVSTDRILSGACANWALDASFGMIKHLYRIGYEPPNIAWFEAFHPGFQEKLAATAQGGSGVRKIRDILGGHTPPEKKDA